jgi:hypothetical protein
VDLSGLTSLPEPGTHGMYNHINFALEFKKLDDGEKKMRTPKKNSKRGIIII